MSKTTVEVEIKWLERLLELERGITNPDSGYSVDKAAIVHLFGYIESAESLINKQL